MVQRIQTFDIPGGGITHCTQNEFDKYILGVDKRQGWRLCLESKRYFMSIRIVLERLLHIRFRSDSGNTNPWYGLVADSISAGSTIEILKMNWIEDKRFIHRVKLDNQVYTAKATIFTRIEYPGEYCMIPWIRIASVIKDSIIECPIHKLDFIEYY